MVNDTSRRRFLALAGSTTAVALAGCSGTDIGGGESTDGESMDETETGSMDETEGEMMSEPVSVTVRIENVAPTDFYDSMTPTNGQIWITPGTFAVHTESNPIFTAGEAASVGLEAQAEAGLPTGFEGEPGLVDELQDMEMGVSNVGAFTPEDAVADSNDPMGEVPGAPPIAPQGAFEFDIEAEPGQRLSFASMFVPSNDLFFAPGAEGIELWPMDGEPVSGDVTDSVDLWDAGTEPNGAPGNDPDQAPAQDSPDQGDDEDGVVQRLSAVDDGYNYPAVDEAIRVTLMPDSMG